MNQGMVTSSRSGGVTFWALMVSIAVHLVILSVFGIVKFSRCESQGEVGRAPVGRMSLLKRVAEISAVLPKPKIKKAAKERFTSTTDRILPANLIFDVAKPSPQNLVNLTNQSSLQTVSLLPSGGVLPHKIEFFGSSTSGRKICYVVDCSGSMRGVFGQVRKKLKESIESLQPDQYFCIIFFGGNKLFEFGDGSLVRATQKAKSEAYDFIDSIEPSGQTNALAALERAVQIRDGAGVNPSVIYFLTDGFELTTEAEWKFSQKAANLLKMFAPTTRINTIGFWPVAGGREVLEAIARQSGGEFIFVADDI